MARTQTTARVASIPAPTGGWVSNRNLALPSQGDTPGAFVLENFFPGVDTIKLRRGSALHATVGDGSDPVETIMTYADGNNVRMFAATADSIYEITTVADPEVSPAAVVTGLSNGKWSFEQMMTTGGVYLVCVNGEDDMLLFDGTYWWTVNDQAISSITFGTETSPFTEGETLTGGTSGATATIVRVVSDGTDGTLYVRGISGGPFQSGEALTDGAGGAATATSANVGFIPAIVPGSTTPITTDQFSYVWSYQKRLFFAQKNSLKAWYLPIDQIGNEANVIPLGGEVPLGGSLLFGSPWSLDTSGQGGLSEQCAFVTTKGEVAVYQGNNPASADNWKKVGTYRVGAPLGPNAWIRAGGDIVVATTIGFTPLSQAVNRDVAALSPAAVSYPIEPDWLAGTLAAPDNWSCLVWPEHQLAAIAPPPPSSGEPTFWVVNTRSGAWAPWTNWAARCLALFEGRMFFGSDDGMVLEANVGGSDLGDPYTGKALPLYDDVQSGAARKYPLQAKLMTRAPLPVAASVRMMFDYDEILPAVPAAAVVSGASLWGSAVWDESTWSAGPVRSVRSQWASVGGSGYAMSSLVQVTSGSDIPLDIEIIRVDVTFDTAGIVT